MFRFTAPIQTFDETTLTVHVKNNLFHCDVQYIELLETFKDLLFMLHKFIFNFQLFSLLTDEDPTGLKRLDKIKLQ